MTDERTRLVGHRAALLARMRTVAATASPPMAVRRVHLLVAMDRFLQRLLAVTDPGAWALKGGLVNQLRHPDDARFTEDIDLRIEADLDAATTMIVAAVTHRSDDPFTFELESSPRPLVGPPGGGLRFGVAVRVSGELLVRFKVDVSSRDALIGNVDQLRSDPLVERFGFSRATFPAYPIEQQLAEKFHAYTLPRHGQNTRAKDLADMIWIIGRSSVESTRLRDATRATFERRATHPWPATVPRPPAGWARQYAALRVEMSLPPASLQAAHEALVAFMAPVLVREARSQWDPVRAAWVDDPTG